MSAAFRRVLVLSAILKVGLAILFANLPLHYDEVEFLDFGRKILGGAAPVLWRAPGYQVFVACGLALAGGQTVGVRLLQALVSCGTSIVAYRIGRDRFGERAGLFAGVFTAFAPTSVSFSHLLWSETVYELAVLVGFALLLAGDAGKRWSAPAAGFVLGLAALTRSTGLVLVVVSVFWLVTRERRFGRAAAFAGSAALVLLPYAAFASARAGRLVLTDTNSGFNLWSGNNELIPPDLPSLWSVGLPLDNGTTLPLPDGTWRGLVAYQWKQEGVAPSDTDSWYRKRAMAYIRDHPWAVLRRLPSKVAAFWSADFFLPRHLLRDWYGALSPPVAMILVLLTWAAAAVPLLLGPGCLAVLARDRFRTLAVGFVLSYVAVHAVAYGHARMHEPLVPILVLAVAACRSRALPLGRGLPLVALALAAWVFIAPVVAGVYLMPGPRHATFARIAAAGRFLPLPGAPRLGWMLAGVEEARGRPDEALRILSERPVAGLAWSAVLRGTIEERRGRIREAEAEFAKAYAADPGLYEGALGLGRTRLARGDAAGALEPLRRAAVIRPWEDASR